MRKALAYLVAAGLGLALGRVFENPAVTAARTAGGARGGEGGCSVEDARLLSADADGNGELELTDAVAILRFLFAGGPEPPCLASEVGERPARLPDTGQTACYGNPRRTGWAEIPCAEAACIGQDGSYTTGCSSGEGRFTDNGDGTVTDTCTGLMWQKDTADVNGDGQVSTESAGGDMVPWCEALAYCEALELAGHDDWRLPNVRELQSIVDYGRWYPAIDPVFGVLPHRYWSSTSVGDSPFLAWFIFFGVGYAIVADKDNLIHVRAVRSGS